MAFRLHCERYASYLDAMERELTDIDFVSSSKDRKRVRAFFEQLGYDEDRDIMIATEGDRYFYRNPMNLLGVDIFFDRLNYCHPIELAGRLHLDSPTITLADLVLEKIQIVELNEKDVKDLIVLLLEHDVGGGSPERVDDAYIASLLSADWGFYHTATTNLGKVVSFLDRYPQLSSDEVATVAERLGRLRGRIESEPKTMKWRVRAKVGTKVRWYNEVSAKEATF